MPRSEVVLVLNAGSSSLKYQVRRLPAGERVLGDHIERVDRDGWNTALREVVDSVASAGVTDQLTAVGHRVVHGGPLHTEPTLVDPALVASIEDLSRLAPLHNPPAVEGIRRASAAFPDPSAGRRVRHRLLQ